MKRDVVGRVVTPCAKREELLDEFERSALSGAEFARLAGVKYQTFAGWVQRRRHARGAYGVRRPMPTPQEAAAGLRLVEAVVASTARPAPMAVTRLRIDLQTPVERQVALVREFERSGSGPRFAAMAGIKYQTFVTWRRKHGNGSARQVRGQAPPLTLVEAVAAPDNQDDPALTIELPGGARLGVWHPGQVALAALLIKQLATASPC